jgi:tyrosyl-tRNA synthetase
MFPPIKEQIDLIGKNTVEIIPEDELEKKLERSRKTNKPLIVKLGCDPSKPDLHIGHSVVLQKLRDFQDLGHKVILIIGDFTGMIGDPSGRNVTRPPLSLEETRVNGKTYYEQASRILSKRNLEIRYNSEWLEKLSFRDVIKLASSYTVARILERDDFEKRLEADEPISMHELLYPLSQAYDSVAIKADVELGGTDQKFNLLVGRDIQQAHGQEPQVIITTELLEGIDGVEKMSKSLDNAISFNDSPKDIFGRTMSIPDTLIYKYFRLCTDVGGGELAEINRELDGGKTNPRDLKVRLAYELVKKYYNAKEAKEAKEEFERVFSKREIPDDIEEFRIREKYSGSEITGVQLLVVSGSAASKGEARRLIEQGAVDVDGRRLKDMREQITLDRDFILKVGKRRFLKIKV